MEEKLILFDDRCSLCTGSVRFIARRDRNCSFRFLPLHSAAGREVLQRFHLQSASSGIHDTFVLVDDGRPLLRSDGVLHAARALGGPWRLLYGLMIIPRPVRDAAYNVFARMRYRWFGRTGECRLP